MIKSLLARNLSKLRSLNHLNQTNLADKLGVTRNKIASYESQNIEPKLQLLVKISELFQVSIDDLVGTEIQEENYDALTKRYLAWHKGLLQTGENCSDKFQCKLDRSVVVEFINNNEGIGKMVEGMRTFYDFKNRNSILSAESQQLMYILDHLLDTNEAILNEFKKVQNTV